MARCIFQLLHFHIHDENERSAPKFRSKFITLISMTDISDDSISNQFFSFSDHTLPYVVNYQMKANRNAQVIVNIIDDFCEVKIPLNNKVNLNID